MSFPNTTLFSTTKCWIFLCYSLFSINSFFCQSNGFTKLLSLEPPNEAIALGPYMNMQVSTWLAWEGLKKKRTKKGKKKKKKSELDIG